MIKKLTVCKSNDLIEAKYNLTLSEQRLVLACIAQINSINNLTDDKLFTLRAKDFAELFNISEDRAYSEIKKVSKRLYDRSIIIFRPNEEKDKQYLETRWIQSRVYGSDLGEVSIRFSKDIIPYLAGLRAEFTQYDLINIANMSSVYAIRLYEILMQWKNIGLKEIELNWLKKNFEIEQEYSRMFDLKKYVIEPAIKQINKHSDLWVEYSQKKRGRKITHFIFEFGLKEEQTKKSIAKPKKTARDPILEALMLNGLSQAIAKRFLNENGTKSVQKTLKYYEQCLKEGKILKEGGGYLIRLLEAKAEYQQPSSTNTKRMTLSEYCRLPENHRRTMGKNDSELIVMMRREGIIVER